MDYRLRRFSLYFGRSIPEFQIPSICGYTALEFPYLLGDCSFHASFDMDTFENQGAEKGQVFGNSVTLGYALV